MSRRGFTLLEVLIAMAVFAIIAVATVRHVSQIVSTKNSAFEDIDLYNEVRAAISLMRSDLGQAFHVLYADLGPEAKNAVLAGSAAPHTLFDGRKNELIFTSLNHHVYFAGKKECDQTEVSYYLQKKGNSRYPSLMKREAERIDEDLYHGGNTYTLVDNVTQLEFQYWDEKQEKWFDDWNSDNGVYRDKFPYAIKMKLGVVSGNKTLAIETEIKVAFPNNDAVLVQF